MATTVSLAYESTFNVYDSVSGERIGQIMPTALEGWSAYRTTATDRIVEKRIGTYPTAEDAAWALAEIRNPK